MKILVSTLLGLPGLLVAQSLVVDVNNGPGTNYTSLDDAATNAPDGAVLEVRAGAYSNFRIVDKSLTVLADPGVTIEPGIFSRVPGVEIVDLDAGSYVTLRGLDFGMLIERLAISCRDSQGAILIENCTADGANPFGSGRLRAANCDHVYVRDCSFQLNSVLESPAESFNSNMTLLGTSLVSAEFCLRQGGGRIVMADCNCESASGIFSTALCFLSTGHLTLNGGTTLRATTPAAVPFAAGTGNIVIDPSVQLAGMARPAGPGLTVTQRRVPFVDAFTGQRGSTATGTLQLIPGEAGALLIGFPDAPEFFPGILDPFWLAEATVQTQGSTPTLTGSYQVPNAPWVLGVQVVWQAATFSPGTPVRVSNPASYVHR